MKLVSLYLNNEDYSILIRKVLDMKLQGEKISINKLILAQIQPFIDSLKNGNRDAALESKQDNKPDIEQDNEVSSDSVSGDSEQITTPDDEQEKGPIMNFDDLDL